MKSNHSRKMTFGLSACLSLIFSDISTKLSQAEFTVKAPIMHKTSRISGRKEIPNLIQKCGTESRRSQGVTSNTSSEVFPVEFQLRMITLGCQCSAIIFTQGTRLPLPRFAGHRCRLKITPNCIIKECTN